MSIQSRISKGDVVLVRFPFTDLSGSKLRPALVLLISGDDAVLAFISSRMDRYKEGYSILIPDTHPEFPETGLKVSSIVRLDKIATVHRRFIAGRLGSLGKELKENVNEVLCSLLSL